MWGCRPSDTVDAKTEMVSDLIKILMNNYNKTKLTFVIPQGFEHLKGKDANFEMVTSNTIQPVQLHFNQNFVAHSISRIFVTSDCNGLVYKCAEIKG